ncbi:hypothetical protein ABPG72_016954 [Tetrahymena utriculariae]
MDQLQQDHICGNDIHEQNLVRIFWVVYEIIIIVGGIYLSYLWYINRKMFPLMERSPLLSIYFIINVVIYAISYPLFLQSSYLSQNFDSLLLKCIFIPFQGSYTYIYLLKSCRLSWGFYINRQGILQKYQSKINYFFKSEVILIIVCLVLLAFNIVTEILPSPQFTQIDFVFTDLQEIKFQIFLARVIESYFGLCYLFICLWIVRNVDKRVSIKNELYFILACDLIASTLRPGFTISLSKDSNMCLYNNIPLLYLINWTKLFFTLVIGMIRPLKIMNQQHQYYNPILLKKFDTFLSYKPEIFDQFINYCKLKSEEQKQQMQNQHNLQQNINSNDFFRNQPENRSQSPLFTQQSQGEQFSENQIEQQNIRLIGVQPYSSQNQDQLNQSQYDSVRNQNNSQESYPADSSFQSREHFLHVFQYERVRAHLDLFQKGMQLRSQNKDSSIYIEEFKKHLLQLKQEGQFQILYQDTIQNSEIHSKICYLLQLDSFNFVINRDDIHNQFQQDLISSNVGNLATLYHSCQQQQSNSDDSSSEDPFRRQLEPIQIVQKIMEQSKNFLEPIYNEFKTTESFYTIKKELDQLVKAYANLQKINMALDQNMRIE